MPNSHAGNTNIQGSGLLCKLQAILLIAVGVSIGKKNDVIDTCWV